MSTTTANLRRSKEFFALSQAIREISSNEKILYCPSPGNWGDALINFGTSQFLDFYGIEFDEANRQQVTEYAHVDETSKNKVLLVGGGGGWCKNWPTTRAFVQ